MRREISSKKTPEEATMFDAQLLFAEQEFPAIYVTEVFSPWFAREGDNARFTLELIESESAELEVAVFHKNRTDTGDGVQVGGTITRTTAGRETSEWIGLEELVRYRYRVTATKDGLAWVLLRMLSAVWFDTVRA